MIVESLCIARGIWQRREIREEDEAKGKPKEREREEMKLELRISGQEREE